MKPAISLLTLGIAVLLAACSNDDDMGGPEGNPVAVEFGSGNIATLRSTTTTGGETHWTQGDQIGIYMMPESGGITTATADNIAYQAQTGNSTQSAFTPVSTSETLYYPQDGSKVDFIAYHPYKTPLTGHTYNIDVSNQSAPAAIDVLYSNNAAGYDKTSGTVDLRFAHALAKLTVNVTAGTGAPGLAGLAITLGGQYKSGNLSLSDGSTFTALQTGDIAMREVTAGAAYEAILIPQGAVTGSKALFTVGSNTYEWDISAINFQPGMKYTYTVTVDKTGITVAAGDITGWTGATNNPTEGVGGIFYEVGDFWPDPTATTADGGTTWTGTKPAGIVFWVDPSDSRHGKAVSLTENSAIGWSDTSNNNTATGATDQNNGRVNMRTIYNRTTGFASYPAFAWVHAMNPAGTDYSDASATGIWYLPALNELTALYGALVAVNTGLTAAKGTSLSAQTYWSSSEINTGFAYTVRFNNGAPFQFGKASTVRVRGVLAF